MYYVLSENVIMTGFHFRADAMLGLFLTYLGIWSLTRLFSFDRVEKTKQLILIKFFLFFKPTFESINEFLK